MLFDNNQGPKLNIALYKQMLPKRGILKTENFFLYITKIYTAEGVHIISSCHYLAHWSKCKHDEVYCVIIPLLHENTISTQFII